MLSLLGSNPLLFLIYIIALFLAITIHEYSHAKVADYLGDPTPRLQGRLSFNPLVHLDPIGVLLLLLVGFGWGKPVVFDPFNLKDPRRDAALISIAGPGSNIILALLLSLLLRLLTIFDQSILSTIGITVVVPIIVLNVVLGIFNLLPIAPLDGFKIVGGFLSQERAQEWYQLERYGILFILLLLIPINGSSLLSSIIKPAIDFVLTLLLPSNLVGGGII